jgi:hypothetical protein
MAKFIFTESQVEKIKKSLNEDFPGADDNYRVGKCEVYVEYHGVKFKGYSVDQITSSEIDFTFNIDMNIKSYGIRDISVYNPQGPSEIELEVTYFPNEDEDSVDETITVPLNWEDAEEEQTDSIGYIGYHNEITLSLKNDENGNIVVDSMTLFKNSI